MSNRVSTFAGNSDSRPLSVLILGAGTMQIPAIAAAKAMGWRVAIADGRSVAEAAARADQFAVVDLKDEPGMLAFARDIKSRHGLDAVFTAGTDFSKTVACVTDALGLPGHSYSAACAASDKAVMRRCFEAAGVPSPRYRVITNQDRLTEQLDAACDGLRFPLVIKPVDNMGARGVMRVNSADAVAAAVSAALKFSRSGRCVVEEFVSGPEFSIDALVWDNKVEVFGVADRHVFYPPFFIEMGHTIPTEIAAEAERRLVSVFVAAVRALGLSHGAAKGDVFLTPDGPVIGEIAARLSGGYMSGWTLPFAHGVNVTAAALRLAAGLPIDDPVPTWHRHCAERAFVSIPGTVTAIGGLPGVPSSEPPVVPGLGSRGTRVEACFLRVGVGTSVVFPTNNVEKCGNVIATADSRSAAVAAAEAAVAKVALWLDADDRTTGDALFAASESSTPPAYAALPPALVAAIDALLVAHDNRYAEIASLPVPIPSAVLFADSTDGAAVIGRRDWNHRTWTQSFTALESAGWVGQAGLSSVGAAVVADTWPFWVAAAVVLGGIQAAQWLVDRSRKHADTVQWRQNVITRWITYRSNR